MSVDPTNHYGNKINESLMGTFLSMLFGAKLRKQYKKVYKKAKDDPELKAALLSHLKQTERLNDLVSSVCDRNPDFPACDGVKVKKRNRHRK